MLGEKGVETMSDAWNREVKQAFLNAQDQVLPGPDCPSPDLIWACATALETSRQKRELLEHTATCPACAGVWRLATAIAEEVPEVQPDGAKVQPKKPYRPFLWSAAVAAMFLVFLLSMPLTNQIPSYRLEPQSPIQSSTPAVLDRNHCLLQWTVTGEETMVHYKILVSTADLEPLISAEDLTETRFMVPASTIANIPKDGQILWRVTAISSDGRQLLSETFINQLN